MKLDAQKTALDGGAPTVSEQLVPSGLLNPPVLPGEQARANRVIVSDEINPCEPSTKGDFEKMARRRFQAPQPARRGKWWCLRYWQDIFKDGRRIRERVRVKLAPATMPEREVKKIAAEHLRPMNQGLMTVGSATNFTEFVDQVYTQVTLPKMASSTQDRYQGIIDNYLKPQFGGLCLREISVLTVDRYLSGLSKTKLSHESMDKIRDVLSSILESAVRYELLVKNPVEGIRLPKPKTGKRTKPFITPEQFEALLKLIVEPYASMTYVAVYTGLRVSELVGLRWRNVHPDSISIEERYCRGDWGAPKSQSSNATIPVNRSVIERIHHLKAVTVEVKAGSAVRRYAAVKACGPDDLVFQSVQKGAPMRDNNILVRHIKPPARKLGLGFVNWLVLRRSFATWLKMVGADVKDAQALMRHSRASTTLDIYQQFIPESERKVVDKLSGLSSMVN
jgi:integrase